MTKKNLKPLRGNKGEWSEFYAFVKILADGKLFTADKNLKILKNNFHLVLKVVRQESEGRKEYDISKNDGQVYVISEGIEVRAVDLVMVQEGVSKIFEQIKKSKGTTFTIDEALPIMKKLYCNQLRASSGQKADLIIILYDRKSPTFPELGFSIKSLLGSPATLLNASGATNFVYKIVRESDGEYQIHSDISVRETAKSIYGSGDDLEFLGVENQVFWNNLRKIDSNFPKILAEILKKYYRGEGANVKDLVNKVSENSSFMREIDFTAEMLKIVMKRFLSSIALGMVPSRNWDGYTEAHGGYLIVKNDGEVACYHLYNRDKFEDYLFHNTKLDTPSTTKHRFGKIYKDSEGFYIKLNLQIRFIK